MQCISNTLICLFLFDFHFWQQTNTPSQCWYNCSRNSLRVYALNTITFSLTLIAISLSRMSRFINEIYLTQVPAWCGGFKVMEMQFLESLWAISLQIRPQRVDGGAYYEAGIWQNDLGQLCIQINPMHPSPSILSDAGVLTPPPHTHTSNGI